MGMRPTEARHPQAAGLHALSGEAALAHLLQAQVTAAGAVRAALPGIEAAAGLAAGALRAGGKLGYAGAGSAGLMALADALELWGTFGIQPDRTPVLFAGGAGALLHMTGGVEDDPALAAVDLAAAGFGPGDAVICVSASGTTPYTLAVARGAQAAGARVIGIANVPGSPLLALADVAITLETGAEMIAGSTRLGAGTAQKLALNLISCRMGLFLGHVHDGYMVNVVAENAKLRARAEGIVAAVSGAGAIPAAQALAATGGAVKPAVLVARGMTPGAAAEALERTGGHLGPLLG